MSDTEENRAPPAEQNYDIKPTGEESDPNAPINIKVSILANNVPALCLCSCVSLGLPELTRGSFQQVVSAQGEEVFFKIKRSTQLRKLQTAYAHKIGKEVNSIRRVS